jgi:hypothetical protein
LHEARGAGRTRCEIGPVQPCEARGVGTHGARQEVQGRAARGGSNATVQGPRCRGTRREARGAGKRGGRRVRPVRTKGGSITVLPTNQKTFTPSFKKKTFTLVLVSGTLYAFTSSVKDGRSRLRRQLRGINVTNNTFSSRTDWIKAHDTCNTATARS